MVDKLDVQNARDLRVENRKPVLTFLLKGRVEFLKIEITKVVDISIGDVGGSWTRDLRRGSCIRIRDLMSLLRGCRPDRSSAARFAWARG